jgi:hypothetical protein
MSTSKTIWIPADVNRRLQAYHQRQFEEHESVPTYRSINRLLRDAEPELET